MFIIMTFDKKRELVQQAWFCAIQQKQETQKRTKQEIEQVFVLMASYHASKDSSKVQSEEVDAVGNIRFIDMSLPEVNFEIQANLVLVQMSRIIQEAVQTSKPLPDHESRGILLLVTPAFKAGLYEALQTQFNKEAEDNGFFQFTLRPFLPEDMPKQRTDPFLHKNPNKGIEKKDLSFWLDLFDQEERHQIESAILSRRNVLITGGRGTGKTLLARYIHFHTQETSLGEFIFQNFAAITKELAEAEIRGVAKGAATGVEAKEGFLTLADKGTLFLDEIAEADDDLQKRLLDLISDRIEPVQFRVQGGSRKLMTSTVRFIAATNRMGQDLSSKLRKDLQARFPVRINLKYLDQKSDPFDFYVKAIRHFTKVELTPYFIPVPEWEQPALEAIFHAKEDIRSLRELANLVSNILDHRRCSSQARLEDAIKKEEVTQHLHELHINDHFIDGSAGTHPTIETLRTLLTGIEQQGGLDGLPELSKRDAQDLVHQVKVLALNLAKWHDPHSTMGKMSTYGMANFKSFKKLMADPSLLHPERGNARKSKIVPEAPSS